MARGIGKLQIRRLFWVGFDLRAIKHSFFPCHLFRNDYRKTLEALISVGFFHTCVPIGTGFDHNITVLIMLS